VTVQFENFTLAARSAVSDSRTLKTQCRMDRNKV